MGARIDAQLPNFFALIRFVCVTRTSCVFLYFNGRLVRRTWYEH